GIGKDLQKGRLLEFRGEGLFEREIENRLSRVVIEVRKNNRILLCKMSAFVCLVIGKRSHHRKHSKRKGNHDGTLPTKPRSSLLMFRFPGRRRSLGPGTGYMHVCDSRARTGGRSNTSFGLFCDSLHAGMRFVFHRQSKELSRLHIATKPL